MKYYYSKTINDNFENTEKRITDALADQGFGIITEINFKETFKAKLDKDIDKYKVLGACSPQNAFNAISVEERVALMLPCNVLLHEKEDGVTEVSAVEPPASMQAIENEELKPILEEIKVRLHKAVDSLTVEPI